MNKYTWVFCYKEAIAVMKDFRVSYITCDRTLCRWHIQFGKGEQFPIPNAHVLKEPKLFGYFPETKKN